MTVYKCDRCGELFERKITPRETVCRSLPEPTDWTWRSRDFCRNCLEELQSWLKRNEGGKRGKWIDVEEDCTVAQCSVCGEVYDAISPKEDASPEWWSVFCKEYKYCPKCGAKMETEEEK